MMRQHFLQPRREVGRHLGRVAVAERRRHEEAQPGNLAHIKPEKIERGALMHFYSTLKMMS